MQKKSDTFLDVLGGTAARSIIRWGGQHFFVPKSFLRSRQGIGGVRRLFLLGRGWRRAYRGEAFYHLGKVWQVHLRR